MSLMIPGTTSCPAHWQLEYSGFLASDYRHYSRTEYACVDREAEVTSGGSSSSGALLFAVRARCGALPCPPYRDRREVACVVCSR